MHATVYNAIIATMASFRLDPGNRSALGALFSRRTLQAQEQAATFLESQGATVIDPDGDLPLFEAPIRGDVPDDLGFVGVP